MTWLDFIFFGVSCNYALRAATVNKYPKISLELTKISYRRCTVNFCYLTRARVGYLLYMESFILYVSNSFNLNYSHFKKNRHGDSNNNLPWNSMRIWSTNSNINTIDFDDIGCVEIVWISMWLRRKSIANAAPREIFLMWLNFVFNHFKWCSLLELLR